MPNENFVSTYSINQIFRDYDYIKDNCQNTSGDRNDVMLRAVYEI